MMSFNTAGKYSVRISAFQMKGEVMAYNLAKECGDA
jgi:hypothetical protein